MGVAPGSVRELVKVRRPSDSALSLGCLVMPEYAVDGLERETDALADLFKTGSDGLGVGFVLTGERPGNVSIRVAGEAAVVAEVGELLSLLCGTAVVARKMSLPVTLSCFWGQVQIDGRARVATVPGKLAQNLS